MTDLEKLANEVEDARKELKRLASLPGDKGEVFFNRIVAEYTNPPDGKQGTEVFRKLIDAAYALGVPRVRLADTLAKGERGRTNLVFGIELRYTGNYTGMATVLAHELAHWVAHVESDLTPGPTPETQAEGVAYLVMLHFGITSTRSGFYLAQSLARGETVLANRRVIERVTKEILDAVK